MTLDLTMLSMVNANRFINIGAIPLVIVAYSVFLCVDHNRNVNIADIKHHIQDIQNSGSVDGLVFGGSNAFYSLSAESISYYTGMKWYNASMDSEVVTGTRIIHDLITRIDQTKVKYFVYSSILPYTIGEVNSYTLDQKVIGEGIKPIRSIFAYMKNGGNYPRTRNSEIRNGFGDIVFDRIKCDFTADNHFDLIHAREEIGISLESLIDKAIYFASMFPNASILIVLPSGYYGGLIFDDLMFDQALRTKFYSVLSGKHFQNSTVKIIVQPPYASVKQVCDGPWHANEDGRAWRTQNLIEFMIKSDASVSDSQGHPENVRGGAADPSRVSSLKPMTMHPPSPHLTH
jgi:hypothetical protein